MSKFGAAKRGSHAAQYPALGLASTFLYAMSNLSPPLVTTSGITPAAGDMQTCGA